jgi:hypothetical protein
MGQQPLNSIAFTFPAHHIGRSRNYPEILTAVGADSTAVITARLGWFKTCVTVGAVHGELLGWFVKQLQQAKASTERITTTVNVAEMPRLYTAAIDASIGTLNGMVRCSGERIPGPKKNQLSRC